MCMTLYMYVYVCTFGVYIAHVMLNDFVRLDITYLGLVKLDIAYIL